MSPSQCRLTLTLNHAALEGRPAGLSRAGYDRPPVPVSPVGKGEAGDYGRVGSFDAGAGGAGGDGAGEAGGIGPCSYFGFR